LDEHLIDTRAISCATNSASLSPRPDVRSGNQVRYSISDSSVFDVCEQVCAGVRRQLHELETILSPPELRSHGRPPATVCCSVGTALGNATGADDALQWYLPAYRLAPDRSPASRGEPP
jgi:hypothetical protein